MVKTNDVDNPIFFLKKVIDRNYRKLNGSVGTNQKKDPPAKKTNKKYQRENSESHNQ